MKKSFLIYSEDKEKDNEILEKLKYWLPTDIDIQKAKIKRNQLISLDGKLIDSLPLILEKKERPIYMTDDALDKMKNIELICKSFNAFNDIENISIFLSKMKKDREIIIGRSALAEFTENLKRHYFSP